MTAQGMFKQPVVMWEPGPQPDGGGQSGNCSPKFLKTYVFLRYSNKLFHFAPPENISWLRPWWDHWLAQRLQI